MTNNELKKLIKNGMIFSTCDGNYYLKVGNRCVKIDMSLKNIVTFDSIKDINTIFKTNGEYLTSKEGIYD